MNNTSIPVHSFFEVHSEDHPVNVQRININYDLDRKILKVPPHRHDFYEICIFTKGKGFHYMDFTTHPIDAGMVFIIPPNKIHYFDFINEIDGYIIAFTEEFLTTCGDMQFYSLLLKSEQYKAYKSCNNEEFNLLIHDIELELKQSKNGYSQVVKSLLMVLMVRILRLENLDDTENISYSDEGKFLEFKIKVDLYYKSNFYIKDYCSLLSITEKKLHQICKTFCGISPGKIIQDRIIMEARQLLFASDLSIKEIAFNLGFSDPGYFSRFFHKYNHTFPISYREEMKKKYI